MTAELRTSVDIDATPERVWQVLTDLAAYPEWNPLITSATGQLAVGCQLSVTVPLGSSLVPDTMQFTVVEVSPPWRLRFRGRPGPGGLPGLFDMERSLTITPRDGGVRFWQQTLVRGLLVPVITRSVSHRRLPAAHEAMESALKARAEGTDRSV